MRSGGDSPGPLFFHEGLNVNLKKKIPNPPRARARARVCSCVCVRVNEPMQSISENIIAVNHDGSFVDVTLLHTVAVFPLLLLGMD